MRPLRLGVIGAGHLGRIHAHKLATMPDVQLVAIVDPDRDRSESLANELQTRAATGHLDLTGDLDAAVVATPANTHYRIAKELLERRIHAFVEKPLTTRLLEADHLVQIAEDRGAILQVGHIERFNPAWKNCAHELPRPRYIESRRQGRFTFRAADVGVVLDLMIHDLDLVLALTDSEVVEVDAMGLAVLGQHEDIAIARLRFANGCVANLSASRLSPENVRAMSVFCADRFAKIDFQQHKVEWIRPQAAVIERRVNLAELTDVQRRAIESQLFETLLPHTVTSVANHDALASELCEFVSCVRKGESPSVTGEVARDAIAVAETILEQIAEHPWTASMTGLVGALASPSATIFRPRIWHDHEMVSQRKAG